MGANNKASSFDDSFEVNPVNGCWEWIRVLKPQGYGQFGKGALAHRISYEKHKGKIPDGLQIDHLCRNRKCVNPDHLEAVTASTNTLRGDRPKIQKAKTHCPKGHEFSEENTYRYPDGRRSCIICRKQARTENAKKPNRVKMSDRTHCPRGHEYTNENTYYNTKNQRVCRECRRISCRKHYAKFRK